MQMQDFKLRTSRVEGCIQHSPKHAKGRLQIQFTMGQILFSQKEKYLKHVVTVNHEIFASVLLS
jgi:hypothetical protein